MSPFYSLACIVSDDLVVDENGQQKPEEKKLWINWLDEWAEWIMNELPSE